MIRRSSAEHHRTDWTRILRLTLCSTTRGNDAAQGKLEDTMKKLMSLLAFGAAIIPTAAAAHDTETPYASRGACEAASASMSNGEKAWLIATFPEFFDTTGEAASFLTRAWTCDQAADGQYYITDHIEDVLASDWFAQRNH
jgi:hypothetical protein